jgi:hypothetical protein
MGVVIFICTEKKPTGLVKLTKLILKLKVNLFG